MRARFPSATGFRLWAMLLLAIVGMQAAAPPAAVLQLSHGSAFTAETYEVAITRHRNEDARDAGVVPLPADPWLPSSSPKEVPLLRLAIADASTVTGAAVPTDHRRFWRPATRAPPLA